METLRYATVYTVLDGSTDHERGGSGCGGEEKELGSQEDVLKGIMVPEVKRGRRGRKREKEKEGRRGRRSEGRKGMGERK